MAIQWSFRIDRKRRQIQSSNVIDTENSRVSSKILFKFYGLKSVLGISRDIVIKIQGFSKTL